jgi:metal-responsive CopG/Arc/MetJ family transcriptional regulator
MKHRAKDKREGLKSKYVPIRFSPDLLNSVDRLVEVTGTNRSDVIRRLIPDLSRAGQRRGRQGER